MKTKLIRFTVLLAIALVSAACAGQDATGEPGESTADPTASAVEGTATETAGEAATTPTSEVEGAEETSPAPTATGDSGTPTQGAGGTDTTPTVSAEGGTQAPEAGGTAGIPQTGLGEAGVPDNLQDVITILRTAGATVQTGDEVQQDAVAAIGRIVLIDGEEVRFFTYPSAEELEIQASQLANTVDPESPPHYYTLGNMLVFYAGRDPGVRDLLEDVLGAQVPNQ